MITIIILVVLLIILAGGIGTGGYGYGLRTNGPIGFILLVVLLLWLFGVL